MKHTNVRLTDKVHRDVRETASNSGRSMSDIIREALYHGLPEVADLYNQNREYYHEKQKEIEENVAKYLITREFKKKDWNRYLVIKVREWYNEHGFTKDDILELLELHEPIAEQRGRTDMLESLINSVEQEEFNYRGDNW